jgi:hypothetical protein
MLFNMGILLFVMNRYDRGIINREKKKIKNGNILLILID